MMDADMEKQHASCFTIVPMTIETVQQVSDIEAICFSDPWSYQAFLGELDNPMSRTWVAMADGNKAVGFLNASFVLDEGSLNNIAVLDSYRRMGIASLLLTAAMTYCNDHHISFFTLEVRKSNSGAIALYHSFGFKLVGERKNFYTKPPEDALLMTKFF